MKVTQPETSAEGFDRRSSLTRFEVAQNSREAAAGKSLGCKPQKNRYRSPLAAKRRQEFYDAKIAVAASRLLSNPNRNPWDLHPRR